MVFDLGLDIDPIGEDPGTSDGIAASDAGESYSAALGAIYAVNGDEFYELIGSQVPDPRAPTMHELPVNKVPLFNVADARTVRSITVESVGDHEANPFPHEDVNSEAFSGTGAFVPYRNYLYNYDFTTYVNFNHDGFHDNDYYRVPKMRKVQPYRNGRTRFGFLRLELNDSFLHDWYTEQFAGDKKKFEKEKLPIRTYRKVNGTREFYSEEHDDSDATVNRKFEEYNFYYEERVPPSPYTPELRQVALDYKASETVEIEVDPAAPLPTQVREKYSERVEQFMHIHPFGHHEVFPVEPLAGTSLTQEQHNDLRNEVEEIYLENRLVPALLIYNPSEYPEAATPKIEEDVLGELMIGVKGLNLPQNLTLFFQFAEGTGDPDFGVPDVRWSYLEHNQWHSLESRQILADSTRGLLRPGIVNLSLPTVDPSTNSILDNELVWLKVSAIAGDNFELDDIRAFDHVLSLDTQAITVTFQNNDNDPQYLAEPLPAETIEKPELKDLEIEAIVQPYNSFGGKVKEAEAEFQLRVSERLRHKQRAAAAWDFERIILQQFPAVFRANCFNHTNSFGVWEPGHVYVQVIPDPQRVAFANRFQPKVNAVTLEEVERYLQSHVSPFVNLQVRNPIYYTVEVHIDVAFRLGFDSQFYQNKLVTDIQRHISPWAFNEGEEIIFLRELHSSQMVAYVEHLEYVDFVTRCELRQTHEDELPTGALTDLAKAPDALSALTTEVDHIIITVDPNDC